MEGFFHGQLDRMNLHGSPARHPSRPRDGHHERSDRPGDRGNGVTANLLAIGDLEPRQGRYDSPLSIQEKAMQPAARTLLNGLGGILTPIRHRHPTDTQSPPPAGTGCSTSTLRATAPGSGVGSSRRVKRTPASPLTATLRSSVRPVNGTSATVFRLTDQS
jgi:hypothetical protein